ncbi:DUF3365 domain-containing protein [candidate division KSB1 bacterium]|nr:DUF3365 domain-containing protein [candidate division KSB1 bacterium]
MGRFILVLGLLVWIAGCSKDQGQMTAKQEQQIQQIGEEASQALLKNLKQHLMEALNSGDAAEAVEFCAARAMSLTEEVQQSLTPGVQIKRTSFNFRNPNNAPDKHEKAALSHFDSLRAYGQALPEYFIEPIPDTAEYRYYKPIMVAEMCLQCHGVQAKMQLPVKDAILANYPGDLAFGYQPGDFRGLVRVSIPAELITK